MKHYTDTIPLALAEKLKAAGMPIRYANRLVNACPNSGMRVDVIDKVLVCPIYAEVFDWLMEQGVDMELSTRAFFLVWDKDGDPLAIHGKNWHEAATKAIEKALTLI